MKKTILGMVCCATLLTIQPLSADTSIEDGLKQKSAGTVSSRFRGGYSFGLGYQGTLGGDGGTKIQGFLFEAGLYTLINPLRNMFDIELGANVKYNTGVTSTSGDSGKKTYYAGLKQATIYGGTVFRFGETGNALAIGVSKAFYMDEVQSDELKKDNVKKHDLENGMGAYVEYQTDELGGISFIRLEVERMDVVGEVETSEDTVGSILFGMKF